MKKSEFTRKEQKAAIYQRDKAKRLAYQTEYRAKEKAKQDALLAIAMAGGWMKSSPPQRWSS